MLDLSIVIVNFNTIKLTMDCINSVIKSTKGVNFEVIVIDNGSDDGSVEKLKQFRNKITLIENKDNLGFGKANNQGIKLSKGKYILLLNSDTLIERNILKEMLAWMDKISDLGIASCALKNADGSKQGTGGYFPTLIRVFSWMIIQDLPFVDNFIKPFHPMKEKSFVKNTKFYEKEEEVDWVTGAFILMKRDVIDDIGLFDNDYFMYTEETDYCYRAKKKGWKVKYNPMWSVVHFGGASGTKELSIIKEFEGVKIFYKKHYPFWQYPILRILLKIGSLGRIFLFGILEGIESAKIYYKAFLYA